MTDNFLPSSLQNIPQSNFSSLSLLYVPNEEHDNIMYENNRIKGVKFNIYVSIQTNDCNYDYNNELWIFICLFILYVIYKNYQLVYVLFYYYLHPTKKIR